MGCGADDFIAKPFRYSEVFEKIARHLQLEYCYDQPLAPPSTPQTVTDVAVLRAESLTNLPRALVEAMLRATRDGDITRLQQLIDRAATDQPALANGLRVLADAYDYDGLRQLFEGGPC